MFSASSMGTAASASPLSEHAARHGLRSVPQLTKSCADDVTVAAGAVAESSSSTAGPPPSAGWISQVPPPTPVSSSRTGRRTRASAPGHNCGMPTIIHSTPGRTRAWSAGGTAAASGPAGARRS